MPEIVILLDANVEPFPFSVEYLSIDATNEALVADIIFSFFVERSQFTKRVNDDTKGMMFNNNTMTKKKNVES